MAHKADHHIKHQIKSAYAIKMTIFKFLIHISDLTNVSSLHKSSKKKKKNVIFHCTFLQSEVTKQSSFSNPILPTTCHIDIISSPTLHFCN